MNNELKHYGVLGMKWGVRRYQNPNGSLTAAGRKKYLNGDGSLNKKGEKVCIHRMYASYDEFIRK